MTADVPARAVLAVIPARGGSKGIPGKNVAPLAGRPLLDYTVEAARGARCVDRVVVTTDDPEIRDAALRSGAEVPFDRPADLARDETPTMPVLLHALDVLDRIDGYRPDWVMCLQPTSPLRAAADLDAAYAVACAKGADAVVSVAPVALHPSWMLRLERDGRLTEFLPKEGPAPRRQDLPPIFAPNGALYLARRSVLVERRTWYTGATYAYVMPRERSVDVDTPLDLALAELLLLRCADPIPTASPPP